MLTVRAVAQATGVSEATLRAWELRYGLAATTRTSAGYRLYDDLAVSRIHAVKALVDAGWVPSQAAAHVLHGDAVRPARPGEPDLAAAIGPFVNAAAAMDDVAIGAIIADVWARAPFERVIDAWLLPVLDEIGARWADGSLEIAAEHFAASTLLRRLMAEFDSTRNWSRPRVLVGLGPGSRHELGIAAFAATAARAGIDTRYLGADLPAKAWVAAMRDMSADAAVIGVPLADDIDGVRDVVDALSSSFPSAVIAVGGGRQEAIGSPAIALGHDMRGGVRRLAEALDLTLAGSAA